MLKLPTQVRLTKNPAWQSFACESPLWASLASWPPDQPAKLQSKATDLHESSRMGRSRMADLDCNLSRSVPEFSFSFFFSGGNWMKWRERWMESACAQLASASCALLASNPSSARPHVRLCVVHRLSPPGWGRGHWAEPGPFTDWAAPRSISHSGDRTPGRGTGILSSAQGPPRVHGVHGVQAIQSQVPNPPAGVSLVDIARAVGGEKLLISCPDPKPRKKKTSLVPQTRP